VENIFVTKFIQEKFNSLVQGIYKYLEPIDKFLEQSLDSLPSLVMSFDFENLEIIKEGSQKYLAVLLEHTKSQEKRYLRLSRVFNRIRDEDAELKLDLSYWDIQRPIVYRIQQLQELISYLNKLFT